MPLPRSLLDFIPTRTFTQLSLNKMTQRAAVYPKKGEYPVVKERPIPAAKGDKVLVKVNSVGLNPVDWKIIDFGFLVTPPAVLGSDVAGEIVEVGPDVKGYKKGDRIVAWASRASDDEGGQQQYALVGTTPNVISKIPDNITYDEAATLPVGINTAQVALYDKDGLGLPHPFKGGKDFGKGKSILVLGGSAVVGHLALQFLRLSGFTNIITTAATKHETLVKEAGATHVIDRHLAADKQVEQIRSIAPDLEWAWDAISYPETIEVAARSFGPKGGLVVGSLGASFEKVDFKQFENVTGRGIFSNPLNHVESATITWTGLENALRNGDIKPLPFVVAGGLEKTADGLRAVKSASGFKVLIHPQE